MAYSKQWNIFHLLFLSFAAAQIDMATEDETDSNVDWKLIFAYVCFALGAALLLFGFVRLVYYIIYRRRQKIQASESAKDLVRNYYSSPWLKGNTFADAHRNASKDKDDDILRGVDVNAMYSTPIDDRTRIGDDRTRIGDGEHSQTESQIYGSNKNMLRNGDIPDGGAAGGGDGDYYDEPIYSVPHETGMIAEDIDVHASYMEPVKPRHDILVGPQTLQVSSLATPRSMDSSDDVHQASTSSTVGRDQLAVLSALDAATAGEETPRQPAVLDRTLAEEKEIEYTFSSTVYVHAF